MARSHEKSELARERKRLAQDHIARSVTASLQMATSLGALPVGQHPTLDAWRNLSANLLFMPAGSWRHDALPVAVDWSALDPIMVSDLLLASGRADVIQAAGISWTTLATRADVDQIHYMIGSYGRESLPAALSKIKDHSWLVTRLLRGEFNAYNPTTVTLGLAGDLNRMPRITNTALALGLGPDTHVPTASLGLDFTPRFIDVALAHDAPALTKKLLAKARWKTPQEAATTLWSLSLRSVHEWQDGRTHHASLRDGALVQHLLTLNPDPQAPLELNWSMRSALGRLDPEHLHDAFTQKSVPLAFACLLAIHNNDYKDLPTSAHPIHRWGVAKTLATPALLSAVTQDVILPLLERLPACALGEAYGGLGWSGTTLINELAPALPKEEQVAIARLAFTNVIRRVETHDKGDLCPVLNVSFPFTSSWAQGTLGQDEGQYLISMLASTDVPWKKWGKDPASHYQVEPILALFEPATQTLVAQRLQQMSSVAKDDSGDVDRRLALLGQAKLVERAGPRTKM